MDVASTAAAATATAASLTISMTGDNSGGILKCFSFQEQASVSLLQQNIVIANAQTQYKPTPLHSSHHYSSFSFEETDYYFD